VVEDEAIVAHDIRTRLEGMGFDAPDWAPSAEQALQLVAADPPDLVLMDIQLKGAMDGVEAAEVIHREHDIPVVFLTAHADGETVSRVAASGAHGFVTKPFDEAELRVAVELALVKHAATREVEERERWLGTTLRSVGEAIVATDTSGIVTLVNHSAAELTRRTPEESIGAAVDEVLVLSCGESKLPADAHPVRRALADGVDVVLEGECRLRTGGGRVLPVGGVAAPIRCERGIVTGTVCVLRDLSEQRAHEAEVRDLLDTVQASRDALAYEKGFLAALVASMPVPVLVITGEGLVRPVSDLLAGGAESANAPRVTPAPLGEVLSCAKEIREPGECGQGSECDECQVKQAFQDALAGRLVERRRATMATTVGDATRSSVMLVSAAPFDFGGERMAIAVLEDVTELEGLRQLVRDEVAFEGMVGSHPTMLDIYETIREVADIPSPVLITGESGTGKELVARAVHASGSHRDRPFVAVNCSALPEGLLESELFGHVKGAFTGATRDKKGRFELADGGTIFLDEIGELSQAMQIKLLRVLQDSSFERVGGERTLRVDVRVLSATNRDLGEAIAAGDFREDLYYRLCVVPIHVPPLRERVEDIPALAQHALRRAATLAGKDVPELTDDALEALTGHRWPGNVRELQNALEYALIKSRGGSVEAGHLPPTVRAGPPPHPAATIEHYRPRTGLESAQVADALRRARGNKSKAARLLGVSRATLYRFFDRTGKP
jgi:PAS domain S-box-containing protein